jgi:methionyl-tRNA synthetase
VSTYLPADIFTRFCKLLGNECIHVCGTDDFGVPILIKAEQEKKTPEEFVDHWYVEQLRDFKAAGIQFDIFHKTHSPENIELVQHFFRVLNAKGFIFTKEIEQAYCEKCRKFLPDRYIRGTCPYCGTKDQYSDSCEACGRALQPGEIKDAHCAVCGTAPINKITTHYFFDLPHFSEDLKKWLEENQNLQPEVKNYVLHWIKDGLKYWDITRDISWGVPIPLKEASGKVLYGWFDNHIGYISFALKYFSDRGIDGKEFWNSARIYHFIGKDIAYHHYLFLPAMRLGEGSFKLPDAIPTRGYLTLQGQKLSKSRGWYISLRDFLESFPADYLRFYLTRITPYAQTDINFEWDEFQAKINNELVANIGNFIHRTLTFIHSQFDGKVPKPGEYSEEDKEFENEVKRIAVLVGAQMEKIELDKALKSILDFSSACNQYFQKKEPWARKEEAKTTLYLCANAVRSLAILLAPFLPFSAEKLWRLLNFDDSVHEQDWLSASQLKLQAGWEIKRPEILFKIIEDSKIKAQKDKLPK